MYPRRLFSISKTFNIHPQQGKNLFNFRQRRKCFQKMALFIWMEKYVSICVIAWVIVPLPMCWKAYHFYHPVTLVTVIHPWNWQDTSCLCREALVIFEGKSHLNGEKRDGTTKSNTAPDSSVVMFQGYGFDSGLSLIIFHIPLHAVKAHELLT